MTKSTITIHAAALMGGLLTVKDNRGREVPLNVGEDHQITLSEGETVTIGLAARPERDRSADNERAPGFSEARTPAQAQGGALRSPESTQQATRDSRTAADNGAQPDLDQATGGVVADTGPTRTRRSPG